MRTITNTYNVFKFEELSEKAQDKAIECLGYLNVDYDWHDGTYEDAKNIGLTITSFGLDRDRHARGKFICSEKECAEQILKEHGDKCETHIDALNFLKARESLINAAPKDTNGEFVDVDRLDDNLSDLEEEFLKTILEDYSIILQNEYEYLTSREAIIEAIKASHYEFTENGKLD